MIGLKKSPMRHRVFKPSVADPQISSKKSSSNPFDSDEESDTKRTLASSERVSSELKQNASLSDTNASKYYNDVGSSEMTNTSSKHSYSYEQRRRYKDDFHQSGGVDSQNVQELENYAVFKSEETTKSVNNCVRIAEDIREDATKTLVTLHQQGEQITRTHIAAADIDHDLSRSEKLLGSLGGIFSRTWKPTKNRPITGPTITRDDAVRSRANHLEQRGKLGLAPLPNGKPKSRTPPPESADAYQRVEYEKAKQDAGLDDLSSLLGELKGMAIDMGSEIEQQNKALDPLGDDVDELGFRVQNANRRGRRLLGK